MASEIESYLRDVIDPEKPRKGLLPGLLRPALRGLSGVYGHGLSAYLAAEKIGARRRERLPVPVLSIGNLAVGGTGKTPMTAMVCRGLAARGLRAAILSRGHGGDSLDVRVVSEGNGRVLLTAAEAGDEPVLLARSCRHTPVLVGKDRRQSGREALRRWGLDLLVLDDGFQYWQLARDLDVVLLDSLLPFDNGHALPRGLLREPPENLRRAGMVVVTRAGRLARDGEDPALRREELIERIHRYAPGIPVYFADHEPQCFVAQGHAGPIEEPLNLVSGVRVVAVSAIAQPASFHETLTAAVDCHIAECVTKDDHGEFGQADVDRIYETVIRTGAQAVVITEKDAVKWPRDLWPETVPVYALRIAMTVENEDAFFADILARTAAAQPQSAGDGR